MCIRDSSSSIVHGSIFPTYPSSHQSIWPTSLPRHCDSTQSSQFHMKLLRVGSKFYTYFKNFGPSDQTWKVDWWGTRPVDNSALTQIITAWRLLNDKLWKMHTSFTSYNSKRLIVLSSRSIPVTVVSMQNQCSKQHRKYMDTIQCPLPKILCQLFLAM